MDSTTSSIQHYNLKIQNVIDNVKKLEHIQANNNVNLESNNISTLFTQTLELLSHLERAPTQKLKKTIEKRKHKRQKAKLRRKFHHKNYILTVKKNDVKVSTNTLAKVHAKPTTSNKPHQQLRSYRESTRFLRIFELLENLHSVRSEDEKATREFAGKLSRLRSIWNVIRLENKPDFNAAQNIEDQWNIVFFGTPEKSFYKQKRSMTDLISIRRKWDSYITNDSKHGTTIPDSWVLPPEKAHERWQCYRIE